MAFELKMPQIAIIAMLFIAVQGTMCRNLAGDRPGCVLVLLYRNLRASGNRPPSLLIERCRISNNKDLRMIGHGNAGSPIMRLGRNIATTLDPRSFGVMDNRMSGALTIALSVVPTVTGRRMR